MRKTLKWIGIVFGGLVGVLLLAGIAVYFASEGRLNATFEVPPETMSFHNDAQAIVDGEHLAVIRGCTDCHGENLGGKAVIDDSALGRIFASNLTAGEGGIGAVYSDADLARAIRHGIRPEGSGLLVMPSTEYFILSDADVNALVAYIRSRPEVDREIPPIQLTMLARALFMAGQLPPLAAEVIDHQSTRPDAPAADASVEYGQYLATSCTGCHGLDFAGGPVPGAPPEAPLSANLTPAGALSNWDEAGFIETLRTGVTPDGRTLDPRVMPWPMTAVMSDLELQALWAYLRSLPTIP